MNEYTTESLLLRECALPDFRFFLQHEIRKRELEFKKLPIVLFGILPCIQHTLDE